jgi:hypothetical protein
MESIRNIIESAGKWWGKPASAEPSAIPTEPTKAQIAARMQQVDAATASISSAFKQIATSVSVMYGEKPYLITSAHFTNNRHEASTGFDYKGKKLFPVVRQGSLALAEHLAFNPQGVICESDDRMKPERPYRDLSILRILSPEQTRQALAELTGEDSRNRLRQVYASYAELQKYALSRRLTNEELMALTESFKLTPLTLAIDNTERTSSAFAVTYNAGKPSYLSLNATRDPNNDTSVLVDFDCANEIKRGNSGSLIFDISGNNTLQFVGITTAVSVVETRAYATSFSEVLSGLHAVERNTLFREIRDIRRACSVTHDAYAWHSPEGMTSPSTEHLPQNAYNAATNIAKSPSPKPICPAR